MSGLVALGWLVAVLWGAMLWRPAPPALRARLGAPASTSAAGRRRSFRPVVALGRALRSVLGRAPDPGADARLGVTVLVAVVGMAIHPTFGLMAGVTCRLILSRRELRHRRQGTSAVLGALPEAVDLFGLACSAGLSVRQSLEVVAPRLAGPVGDCLRRAQQQIALGVDTAEALEALPAAHEPLRLLVRPLTDALRYGASLGPALEQAAATARSERRRQAELAAKRIPIRLLFPLTVCVLPAFVLLTIVPTVAQSLDFLRF